MSIKKLEAIVECDYCGHITADHCPVKIYEGKHIVGFDLPKGWIDATDIDPIVYCSTFCRDKDQA